MAENQEREEREEQKNTRKWMNVIWLERQMQQCCLVYCNKDNAVMYSLVCSQCMYASQTTHERNACIMYIKRTYYSIDWTWGAIYTSQIVQQYMANVNEKPTQIHTHSHTHTYFVSLCFSFDSVQIVLFRNPNHDVDAKLKPKWKIFYENTIISISTTAASQPASQSTLHIEMLLQHLIKYITHGNINKHSIQPTLA